MPLIAVHAGAGFHGNAYRQEYQQACRDACDSAMKLLTAGKSAVEAVSCAVAVLEDNWITNAGFGSNLNTNGIVECDAGIMNGSNLKWGAVGALQGIRNPVLGAKLVLDEQEKALPLGLVAPNILVGDGARTWCQSRGCASADNLISEKSKETYNRYKKRLADFVGDENGSLDVKKFRLDTVGAVCVDSNGCVASAVSSGGIALKPSGRLGQAASYGSGAWAQDCVATTTSGVGEYLIKTVFARECGNRLLKCPDGNYVSALNEAVQRDFIDSPFLSDVEAHDKLAGVLALVHDKHSGRAELLWGHTTVSMAIGYMHNDAHSLRTSPAKAFVSELPQHLSAGHYSLVESKSFR